jgi:hypothetical protein
MNNEMFGFAIAWTSNVTTVYLSSEINNHPVFVSRKEDARIYQTINDVCDYICLQFTLVSTLPLEWRIIPFESDSNYQSWLLGESAWISLKQEKLFRLPEPDPFRPNYIRGE